MSNQTDTGDGQSNILPLPDEDLASDEEWELWKASVIDHIRTHPPRCLGLLKSSLVDDPEWQRNVEWTLGCPCGCDSFKVLGKRLNDVIRTAEQGTLAGPFAVKCVDCVKATEIFDSRYHGYEAEWEWIHKGIPNHSPSFNGAGHRVIATCASCGTDEFNATAVFRHDADYEFPSLFEDAPEHSDRIQDFFDSFILKLVCKRCGTRAVSVGEECA